MNDVIETRWWWVRHAVVPNAKNVIYGSEDKPCDTSDTESFRGLATLLPENAVWVMTDLQRTHQTTQGIRDGGLVGPESLIEPDLKEQSLGDWHGRTWGDIRDDEEIAYEAFWRLPALGRPPNGESFADLYARAVPVIERLTKEYKGRDIIAVTHGGTIRAAVAMALELDFQRALSVKVDNLSITRLDHVIENGTDGAWRVVGVNRPPKQGPWQGG